MSEHLVWMFENKLSKRTLQDLTSKPKKYLKSLVEALFHLTNGVPSGGSLNLLGSSVLKRIKLLLLVIKLSSTGSMFTVELSPYIMSFDYRTYCSALWKQTCNNWEVLQCLLSCLSLSHTFRLPNWEIRRRREGKKYSWESKEFGKCLEKEELVQRLAAKLIVWMGLSAFLGTVKSAETEALQVLSCLSDIAEHDNSTWICKKILFAECRVYFHHDPLDYKWLRYVLTVGQFLK